MPKLAATADRLPSQFCNAFAIICRSIASSVETWGSSMVVVRAGECAN